jgi:hypothetical protein
MHAGSALDVGRRLMLLTQRWLAWRADIAACCAIVAILMATFAPFLFGHRTLQDSVASTSSLYVTGSREPSPGNIAVYRVLDPGAPAWQTEPWFSLEHKILANERALPVWNPYVAYGAPLLANMQSQPLSPVAWPAIASDSAIGYDIWIVLRLIIAALLTYGFCRCFFGITASTCGALAYGLTGYLIIYLAMPEQSVHVVAPALLWAIERNARHRSLGGIAWIAIAVALLLLGGMPESAFLFLVLATIYALVRSTLIGFSAGTILGSGIAAIVVVPFLEYVKISTSLHDATSTYGTDGDVFSFGRLVLYVAPLLNGPPYNNIFGGFAGEAGLRGYFGAAVAVFAIAAIVDFGSRSERLRAFPKDAFALVSAFLIAKRFQMPVVSLIGLLPGFSRVIMYKYDEPVLGLCVAVLAAYGIERFVRRGSPFWPVVVGVVVVLSLLTTVLVVDRRQVVPNTPHVAYFAASALLVLAILTVLLILAISKNRIGDRRIAFSVAIAGVVTLSVVVPYIVPMYDIVNRSASRSASTLLGAPYVVAAHRTLADGRRFFSPESLLYPDWGSSFDSADPRDVDALFPERYLPFLRAFLHSNQNYFLTDRFVYVDGMDFSDPLVERWMQLSAIGIVAVEHPFKGIDRFPIVYRDDRVRLHRVTNTLPLLSAFSNVVSVSSKDDALSTLTRSDFDPTKTLVVESGKTGDALRSSRPFRTLDIEQRSSTYLRASIDAPMPTMVLDDETNYPGWVARVDGRPVPILAADYLFRAVAVPAGRHSIEFRYEPRSIKIGAAVSIVATVITVFLLIVSGLRTARSAPWWKE